MDITPHIQARSDQLNADDLIGGEITVQITDVREGNSDQPVIVHISGGHCPWKPSKTALRILAAAWGTNGAEWTGRWVTLYRDASVKWGGQVVGGIRPKALSHINGPQTLQLTETRGKKRAWRVEVINPQNAQNSGAPTADLEGVLNDHGLTIEDFDRWRESEGKPPSAGLSANQRARIAAWLAEDDTRTNPIRALIPQPDGEES